MASTINSVGHGLVAGDTFRLVNVDPPDCGINEEHIYYVLASGLTADSFQFSETDGGAAFVLTYEITAADLITADTYAVVSDGVMDAPTTPTTPDAPSVASVEASGLVRLHIVLAAYTDSATRIRNHEVQVTHRYGDEVAQTGAVTGTASTDTISKTAHGFVAGTAFRFKSVTGGAGIVQDVNYYVIASGLTTDAFKFSDTVGGAAFDFTTDISAATIAEVVTPYPDWTYAQTLTLPAGSTDITIPCVPNTAYAVRVRVQDVFGNSSAYNAYPVELTTAAGNDSLYASLAELANDVPDGTITETKIADDSISTPKLKANSITADLLASTLVLASLIKTAASGTRVEISQSGIQLYDGSENLMVNIPTDGSPVFVKGRITASGTLTSETGASLYGTNTLPGSSVTTLENGISAPTSAPVLTASVDYLTLTSTPSGISTAAGIAYDSGAGTFWLACDPTVSPYYVAQEFNATTGALVRSISATGSTTTYTTTLGSTSHVSDTWEATSYAADSQIATPLTLPSYDNIQITKVAGYLAGYGGGVSVKMGLWSSSGVLRRHSAAFTAAEKTFADGNDTLYNKSLSSAYGVAGGTTVWAGWCRTTTGQTHWWTKDTGSSKTTKRGANYDDGDFTSITTNTTEKPNVYITYTYDVDTRLETAPNIGIATDGTYIYTLDNTGVVWKYNRTTLAYVSKSAVITQITGTKSKAGMFYDASDGRLIITTTSGTGAGVYPKCVSVQTSDLTYYAAWTAAAGTTFSGTTDTFRGGARLADPLNSNTATYWIATTSAVYAYTFSGSTLTETSNRSFGQSITAGDGLTHDGTYFRGWDSASPTKVWKFSNWDWTTASALYWVGYSWYDSAGTTHETALGPRASATLRRRERLYVTNAAIPTGGADDPDKVRVYMKPNSTEPTAGQYWLQVTDAATGRYLTDYTGSGTADGAGTAFPAGTPAILKDAGGNWALKGDGTSQFLAPFLAAQDGTHEGGEINFAGASTYKSHTIDVYDDRIRIHSDGNENLSVSSAAGNLNARGYVTSGHTAVSVVGTTGIATTVTTATTWYAVSGVEVSFTPAFIGQKWLITAYLNGYHGNSTNTIAEWNLRVVDGSNATIMDRAMYFYNETAAANEYNGSGGANIWVADSTSTRKLKLYVSSSANSTSITTAYYSFKAIPIP